MNPLFWTPPMRARALSAAQLDQPGLDTVDVGAGTGFATEGVIEHVDAARVTMLDQSAAQLRRAQAKPALAACRKLLGDAEDLPFPDDAFDRYVSCGSIEYWPDPERAIREAHRVLRPGGLAMVAGPLPPSGRAARWLADAWMLFPSRADYVRWFEAAGFADVRVLTVDAPWAASAGDGAYAVAVAGRATRSGAPAPSWSETVPERADEPWTVRRLVRFAAGSLAGALFIPVGIFMKLRAASAGAVPVKGSGLAVAVAGRASPLAAARTLWRFLRPHTLIVTTTSIFGIYVIAAETLPGAAVGNGLGDLALTLVAGALVNLYIVGINQCEDVEIDRVNKPGLPIPAGLLSVRAAWWLVTVSGLLALAMALTQGWVETVAVGAALAIGTAYSSPPFRLKRFPALAAASISLVRAAVVNVGVYLHFASTLGGRPGLSELPGPVVALTLFVLPFSFAIAVLKDIPDAEGDRRYRIATFTVRLGARAAFLMGMTALAGAYLAMIVAAPLLLDDASAAVLVAGHLACLAVLLWLALRVDLTDRVAFTRFYLRVWALFFAEYLLMPLAVAVA